MYRMAMSEFVVFALLLLPDCAFKVLHLRYKTDYFEQEKWEKEWVDAAKDILTEQWETYYKEAEAPIDVSLNEVSYVDNMV